MLDELAVKNLGILSDARIEPGAGLVVVTGETGTGKTMLLGALQLLLGLSARSDLVGPDADETLVEGRFVDVDGDEVVVARRIRKTGRSRAYLNGEMVPLKLIEERLSGLVEVVAQHDHLAIGRETEIRALVDRLISSESYPALEVYRKAWARLREVEQAKSELGGDVRALERDRELSAWQAKEISDSGFAPGDDTELALRADRLRNADALVEDLSLAHRALGAAADEAGEAVAALRKASGVDPGLSELAREGETIAETLAALLGDVRSAAEQVVHDPAAIELAESRLALLGDLRRKYGQTLDEILEFGRRAALREAELDELLERRGRIDQDLREAVSGAETAGRRLLEIRSQAAEALAARTTAHLVELGFTDPVVVIGVEEGDPRPHGTDRLSLKFASDSRLEPAAVTRVASGGELSRLVLALRLAGGAGDAPVIAFDEIDAGVGGKTALALGRKLAELSQDRQVLVVTHLPQVAAFADMQFTVDRDGTTASVRQLTEATQIDELARMLAGLEDSHEGRQHAAELRRTALSFRA